MNLDANNFPTTPLTNGQQKPPTRSTNGISIRLTGATGFLGTAILHQRVHQLNVTYIHSAGISYIVVFLYSKLMRTVPDLAGSSSGAFGFVRVERVSRGVVGWVLGDRDRKGKMGVYLGSIG